MQDHRREAAHSTRRCATSPPPTPEVPTMGIIATIVIGLIVGIVAKLLMPR
jgi:hypothetical protein